MHFKLSQLNKSVKKSIETGTTYLTFLLPNKMLSIFAKMASKLLVWYAVW